MTDPVIDDPELPDGLDIDAVLDATDVLLHDSLAQLFRPPADLETRTQRRVATSLMSRSFLGTASDLLTVGFQTLRLLLSPTDDLNPTDEEVHTS